jgi:beta-N-acetylhexosaminidase
MGCISAAVDDLAGSLLMVAVEGVTLTDDEKTFLRDMRPAGVTLFRRNLSDDIKQIQTLISDIQGTQGHKAPLFIAVDQEGGRVSRLSMVPDYGPAKGLFPGTSASTLSDKEAYGRRLGEALLDLGFNVNFAPVLDILTNENNLAIGDRVFGADPEVVRLRAGAFLGGLQGSGILGCLKHFPGQGDAGGDTHKSSIVIEVSRDQLIAREWVPFMGLLDKCSLIMASHCIYPALSLKPASLSKEILVDLLQKELGYKGLVVSDDMNMAALPQDGLAWQEAIVDSVMAGNDLILVCQGLERCQLALLSLRSKIVKHDSFRDLVAMKAKKIMAVRTNLPK